MTKDEEFQFEGFEPANTTPVPDRCWICHTLRWHWRKERPDGLCDRCSGELLKRVVRHKKRARDKGTEATLTLAQWTEKIRTSQGYCYYCHKYFGFQALVLEHYIPVAMGGGTTSENCVPACGCCNAERWEMVRTEGIA